MKAEEVYNIAIYLPEKELDRLYTLLSKKVGKSSRTVCKPKKRKLITDEEATNYILRTVFHVQNV